MMDVIRDLCARVLICTWRGHVWRAMQEWRRDPNAPAFVSVVDYQTCLRCGARCGEARR